MPVSFWTSRSTLKTRFGNLSKKKKKIGIASFLGKNFAKKFHRRFSSRRCTARFLNFRSRPLSRGKGRRRRIIGNSFRFSPTKQNCAFRTAGRFRLRPPMNLKRTRLRGICRRKGFASARRIRRARCPFCRASSARVSRGGRSGASFWRRAICSGNRKSGGHRGKAGAESRSVSSTSFRKGITSSKRRTASGGTSGSRRWKSTARTAII